MKYLLILSIFAAITSCAKSQSLTSSLTNALPDSVKRWKGLRLMGPAAVYGYSKSSGSTFMTGTGIGYTWQTLSQSSGTWTVNTAVGLMAFAGGSQAPSSFSTVAAVGPYVSFLGGYLSFGGVWNFTAGKPMVVIGAVLPLISN